MTERSRAAALTAAYYAVIFGALGAHLPYWPVWLESRDIGAADIGFFMGAATLVRVAGSTLLPVLADRFAVRRGMIAATSVLSAAIAVAMIAMPAERDLLLAASLAWALATAPTVPLGEALGLRAADRYGFAYAPVRAAGSVAFLMANLGLGALLSRTGPDIVQWTVAAGFLGVAVIGLVHPGGGAPAKAAEDRAAPGEVRALAQDPAMVIFAVTVAAAGSSHMVYYAYSVLDWQAQGISGTTIGQLWALGVLVETALMLGPGRRLVVALGAAGAIAVGAAAGLVRWVAMAAGPELAWLWPLQALHALSFGLAHLGLMAFLAAAVPPRLAGSAQGLISGIWTGGTSALVLFAAGALIGGQGVASGYWLSAGLSALSLAGALLLMLKWRGGRVVAD